MYVCSVGTLALGSVTLTFGIIDHPKNDWVHLAPCEPECGGVPIICLGIMTILTSLSHIATCIHRYILGARQVDRNSGNTLSQG